MRIQIVGCGNEFDQKLGSPSLIIWDKAGGFLINCGISTYTDLDKKNLFRRIQKVFTCNRESASAGALDLFLKNRRFLCQAKTKYYGLKENLYFLSKIDQDYENNVEEYFKIEDTDSIQTMAVNYKSGVPTEAFFNYGLLFVPSSAESLLDTPQARDARMIIHDVSFDTNNNNHTKFNELARASTAVKKKTMLIGYNEGDDILYFNKAINHGFAGFVKKDQILAL